MSERGFVSSVYVDSDDNRVYVDVLVSPTRSHSKIGFISPHRDMWIVPEVGDTVEVDGSIEGEVVARAPLSTSEFQMPESLSQGDIAIKLNDGTKLHFDKQDDGTYDLDLEIDGEMNILANQIYVGDSANSKKVLTEDAVFEYEDTGDTGDGSATPTTKTTSTVSNGEVTQTEVE